MDTIHSVCICTNQTLAVGGGGRMRYVNVNYQPSTSATASSNFSFEERPKEFARSALKRLQIRSAFVRLLGFVREARLGDQRKQTSAFLQV